MKVELLTSQNLEERMKVVATAGKISRTKGNVFEVLDSCDDYDKNLKMVKKILEMGHKSIVEHDYYVFALSDVSAIVEQTLIAYRLTSFTIKSGRETNFKSAGFYIPTFKNQENKLVSNQEQLQEKYHRHMDKLFDEYDSYVKVGIKEEDARFVMPYSFKTNIIMGCDAHELERMVNDFLYGHVSQIDEIRSLGAHLLQIIQDNIPYLCEQVHFNSSHSDWYHKYRLGQPVKSYEHVNLVQSTPNIDETIIESAIMYHEQVTRKEAKSILNILKTQNPHIMEDMMNDIKNCCHQRELEQVSFQFEIPISLIVLKHLTRHRMQSLLIPDFTPMWDLGNYQVPPSIAKEDLKHYQDIQKGNLEMYQYFKKQGVRDEDLIYFYLCGTMVNVITTLNGRSLEWISRMRCCNKAQWEIRDIAKEMVRQVRAVAPLYGTCLGASCDVFKTCPEGKESCGKVRVLRNEKS